MSRFAHFACYSGTVLFAVLVVGCGDRHDGHANSTEPVNNSEPIHSHEPTPNPVSTTAPADNTTHNERDRQGAVTPFDQGNSDADIAMTREIRKAVVADKNLSINAHNVKIITINGTVTLRGPVNSESERAAVIAAAERASGMRPIINQLVVAH